MEGSLAPMREVKRSGFFEGGLDLRFPLGHLPQFLLMLAEDCIRNPFCLSGLDPKTIGVIETIE